MKKTILINIFDSNMVRNILRTDVLKKLVESDDVGRIVLLVHPVKLEEYSKEFASEKVVLDVYPPFKGSKLELLSWFIIRHTIHSKNVRWKINELLYNARGGKLERTLKYLAALTAYYISYIAPVDWLIRVITRAVHDPSRFNPLMEKYKPDLVFLTTIFGTNDIRLLKYCMQHKVATVGMIKSWDNLIGKDPLLMWPDRLIVHNDIVKHMAMSMHHFPADRIYISGLPQMDVYADSTFPEPRDAFLTKLGLDPKKKLITYSAVGILVSFHEVEVIQFLSELVKLGDIHDEVQLLVRLHPAYPSDDEVIKKIPGIVIVRPGKKGAERNPLRFDFEFQESETRDLASTLKWSDVLIQSGSTMAIDGACFDTPIISMGFDGYMENERQERSTRRLLIKDHFKRILDTKGTRAVYTRQELVDTINLYLRDPSTDHEGRMRIVEEQCYKLDGKSGERVGNYILESMRELVP